MSIDKAISQAPMGLSDLLQDIGVDVELDDPLIVEEESVEIILEPESEYDSDFDDNLAEILDDGALGKIASELVELVEADIASRKDWAESFVKGLEVLGVNYEEVYYDPAMERQVAVFIPAEDMIVPYGASNLQNAERVTHVMRKTKNEMRRLQVSGFYRDIDLGEPVQHLSDIEKKKADQQGYKATDDDRYQLLEVHAYWDLEGFEDTDSEGEETGIGLPYVITIDRGTNKILAIRRNYLEDDAKKTKRQHFVDYCYIPGFGFYGMGLIHIIGGYARAGTSLIRQLVDAGTLANLPGGLKARGARIKGDDTPIQPGEFRDVDVPSGVIKDNIMMLPYKEPSGTLLTLLDRITEEGRRLGSISDMKISDMSANAPVGTTLALLERTLKTMGAVQARVHYSMKQEFKLLKGIIRDYSPAEYEYDPQGNDKQVKQSDYDMVEVIPVSDPNSSTMAQRIMQYQAVIQLAQGAPQIYDLPLLHRQMIEVLGVKNAEKLIPGADDQTPKDPISENMAFLNGKPTKAFIYQDQEAHIAAHTAFMQDPMIAAQIGQNPMAQKIQAATMAHIAEHLAFLYRKKVEEQVGVPLPAPDSKLPEDIEVQLSRLVAQGSAQLLQLNQANQQQQQAQQQAQDPLVQMQQAELQLKGQAEQTKAQKIAADIELGKAKLELENKRIDTQAQLDMARMQAQEKQNNQKVQVDLFKRGS